VVAAVEAIGAGDVACCLSNDGEMELILLCDGGGAGECGGGGCGEEEGGGCC
jgi:hypothetical protein